MSEKKFSGIYVPLKVGDIIYTGRFKNKKTTVKTIGVDDTECQRLMGKELVHLG